MSEVQTRTPASRGRVSARGGRGGYSSRGGRGGRSANNSDNVAAFEEEGEIGQMKKKYASTLPMLKELFSDWSDEDLVFALEDADGELEEAIERITEGNVSQWGEVKKKSTDRNRTKAKEAQNVPTETPTAPVRGRGRAGFESRGRARGDRGGRGGRGGRAGAPANGIRGTEKPAVVPTVASTAGTASWSSVAEGTAIKTEKPSDGQTAPTTEPVNEPKDTAPKSSVIPEGTKKGWASLFAKPTPPPQPKPKPAAAPPAAPPVSSEEPPAEPAAEEQKAPEPEPEPTSVAPAATAPAPAPVEKAPEPAIPPAIPKVTPPTATTPTAPTTTTTTDTATPAASTTDATPARDDLTRTNLEQIPDASHPAPTATAASIVGSGLDQNNSAAIATPSRGTPSIYPASTVKSSGRAPGFQRRVMEQQEAVVMPGNHAVDRAAVQFGSMGLNGDAAPVDLDDTREEAETRAQPPQHSPVAPRASLPPSTQPQAPTETPNVSRPAPGLPPVPQATAADSFADFARYTDAHKPYDPFSHQVTQPQPQIQEPFANQAPIQPTVTTGSEYSPFYAADQRLPYNYYGAYGQSQDASAAQRAAAGFGVSGAEVQPHIPTTQPPSRYGHVDAPNSGHTTPNPTLPGATQTPTAQHMPGQSAAAAAAAAHAYGAYGYPYYSNPHYAAYMNQMTQHQYGRNRPMYDDARRYDDHYMPHSSQFGYGSQYGPYSKAGMYGQPFSYDHASSPATTASFSQAMPGRDSVYGRAGSAQPSEAQQTAAGANAFGTGMDVFGRTQAGFGQNQPISQQPPVTAEETKSFDTSKAGGPSPSLAQANRPGSATNNVPGQPQAQTGLPPLQAQQGQQGFGAYPHLNPQYGGLGGLGGHQAANQAASYGNYGGAGFANYYGNTGRGWGGNYGH